MANPKSTPMEMPSFFKVMIGDFRTTVMIPPMFKKHLGGAISKRVTLQSTRGRKWEVKMEIEGTQFFFRDGWETFISDYSISCGDFIVFFYDGDAKFYMKIYGVTACEKVDRSFDPIKETIEIESEDLDEDEASPVGRNGKSYVLEKKRKKNVERSSAGKNNIFRKVLKGEKPADNEKAMEAACAFKTAHPHFVTTCRDAGITYMAIPLELNKKYNLDLKKVIVLWDPLGTPWSVKLAFWKDGRCLLSTGWNDLYKTNGLKEGDVCVMEFVEGGTAINVHFFRAEDHGTKSSSKSGQRCLTGLIAAKSLESRNPKFVIPWTSSPLDHVRVPENVAKKLGLKDDQRMTLVDPAGKSWPVKIVVRSQGQVELKTRWSEVLTGHNFVVGDAFAFEFLRKSDFVKLHIFCVRESGTDIQGKEGLEESTSNIPGKNGSSESNSA